MKVSRLSELIADGIECGVDAEEIESVLISNGFGDDTTALLEENARLKKELAESRARVARFEQAASDLNCHIAKFSSIMWDENGAQITGVDIDYIDLSCDALEAVSNETLAQSLANLRADAVDSFMESVHGEFFSDEDAGGVGKESLIIHGEWYANQLRKGE
jgi:hypothetical protein